MLEENNYKEVYRRVDLLYNSTWTIWRSISVIRGRSSDTDRLVNADAARLSRIDDCVLRRGRRRPYTVDYHLTALLVDDIALRGAAAAVVASIQRMLSVVVLDVAHIGWQFCRREDAFTKVALHCPTCAVSHTTLDALVLKRMCMPKNRVKTELWCVKSHFECLTPLTSSILSVEGGYRTRSRHERRRCCVRAARMHDERYVTVVA